jgi:CTD kinase subunit beta
MLEASGFDFRVRYPQKHLIKLAKESKVDKDISKLAYIIMIDLYRTFAPLKQTCATMAFACIELATLIAEKQQILIRGDEAPRYTKWHTTRSEVVETLLDLLDLYTHFQKSCIVGPSHNIEKFISIRIKLNQEVEGDAKLSRYTEFHEAQRSNGRLNIRTPKTPITPASPSDLRANGRDGVSPATLSPRSSGSGRRGIGARGQDGTVRFMLDVDQAKQEKDTVGEYFKVEYEEYEVEVEEAIRPERDDRGSRNHYHHRNGRDDRSFHHNKRGRR